MSNIEDSGSSHRILPSCTETSDVVSLLSFLRLFSIVYCLSNKTRWSIIYCLSSIVKSIFYCLLSIFVSIFYRLSSIAKSIFYRLLSIVQSIVSRLLSIVFFLNAKILQCGNVKSTIIRRTSYDNSYPLSHFQGRNCKKPKVNLKLIIIILKKMRIIFGFSYQSLTQRFGSAVVDQRG